MHQQKVPPQVRVWQLGLGFANTAVLHALVKAGVIEQLRETPRTLSELVQSCSLNPDMLYRTLRFASTIDVVTYDGDKYTLTDVGRYLLKETPGGIYMGLMLIGSEPWQNAWNNFAHTLATGENAFEAVMGAGFFDYLDRHPEYREPFNQWQTTLTTMAARAITQAYDFSAFKTVCDVGGGQGLLLKNVLSANPHLHGILYDKATAVEKHVLADLTQRVDIQSGNFFEHVPAAELLIMKNILHDWSDEKCQIILRQCREVMQPSTRLLIVERVLATPTDAIGAFYDLHMQVVLGGKERTENEFTVLLQNAGMKLNRIIPTESPLKIIEASL